MLITSGTKLRRRRMHFGQRRTTATAQLWARKLTPTAMESAMPLTQITLGCVVQEADAFRTAPYNGNRTALGSKTDPDYLLSIVPRFFQGAHT